MEFNEKFSYFSHDTDMRNDLKIRGLRRKFGNDGYAVWNYLLEILTDADDWSITFNEDNCELFAADFDVTPDRLREIVEYCVSIGLFQTEGDRLFSVRHQERLRYILDKRQTLSDKRSMAGRKGNAVRWHSQTQDDSNTSQGNGKSSQSDSKSSQAPRKPSPIEEKKKEENRREEKERKENIDYQGIVRLWNDTCRSLPKVLKLNDNRRSKIKVRVAEFGCKTPDDLAAFLGSLFLRCEQSDFLCGGNKSEWTATFDWLFENSTNWVKVSEGNYDNRHGSNRGRTGVQDNLGVGEYITPEGKRTYGSGRANIPQSAPPRPSDRHSWDAQTNSWILI